MHLIIVACLLGGCDLDCLITQLNDPQWRTREAASKQLGEMFDYTVLKRVETEFKTNKSLEVRSRCRSLLRRYYSIVSEHDIPPIWCLPKEYRYNKDGDDLAKEYFDKARAQLKKENVEVYGYRNGDCIALATSLFLMDMLHDPEKFKQVPELRKKMKVLEKQEQLVFSKVAFVEETYCNFDCSVPPAIEEWIEKGRKNEGNYVPSGP